jgi:NADH:ubiquinone oxidoreductase subunit E
MSPKSPPGETPKASSDFRAGADAIAERYGNDPDFLIPMLQDLQAEFGHLPQDSMKRLSEALDIPLSRIYAVATFYTTFSMTPRGKHLITLCVGTVCYLKGAKAISDAIREHLKIGPGGTTEDRLFTFMPVNCLGACAVAPVMMIDEEYFGKLRPEDIPDILRKYAGK